MASHQGPPNGTADVYPKSVSFIDRKTGTEYAADGTVINTTDPYLHDDRTADDVPMVDISDDDPKVDMTGDVPMADMSGGVPMVGLSGNRHPPTSPPPYSGQNEVPWVLSQPPTQYVFMDQPEPTQTTVVQPEDITSYLPLSIFVFLFCCWPLGIWAMTKSVESRRLAREGKYLQAKQIGQEARSLSIYGIIIGIIVIGLTVGFSVWYAHKVEEKIEEQKPDSTYYG